jgi:hypothetical protein
MSSGACRALVAILIALMATFLSVAPMAASNDRLTVRGPTLYVVDPSAGSIKVTITAKLMNPDNDRAYNLGTWGPLIVEDLAQPRVSNGFQIEDAPTDLVGPWRAVDFVTPNIEPGGQATLGVTYTIDGQPSESRLETTPARVGKGYIYFCAVGQDLDVGPITVKILGKDAFKLTQSGTLMEATDDGLKSAPESITSPAQQFTCIEGANVDNLKPKPFVGPDGRQVILQAWPETENWLDRAQENASAALDDIRAFLGQPIPGQGPVVIRETPPASIGGYASAHDTPGIVQLDEDAGNEGAEHQLAHAWFGADNFTELWLREGMAEWTATSMAQAVCAPAGENTAGLMLSDWQVVRPNADQATITQTRIDQEAAACGIVSAVAARMSPEQWLEVIGSLLKGETKYNGSAGPEAASTAQVDYREWLDAVDERGLVPAGQADKAYASNLEDLDFAQDLLAAYGVPTDSDELALRSEARAKYHEFLAFAAPLGAPLMIRQAMDDWDFQDAIAGLEKAYQVAQALKDAEATLKQAGILPLIQPDFEAARNEKELVAVLDKATRLKEQAADLIEPLGQLAEAAPEGWSLPAAITNAIDDIRFPDALAAVAPALQIVTDVSAADAALPKVGLADAYQARYERAASLEDLEALAKEAAADRDAAEKVGAALDVLEQEAQGWSIPSIISSPLSDGRIADATAVVEDARAVVTAARAADAALPDAGLSEDIRPRFEAITSAAELTALRKDAERIQAEAETVGGALASLQQIVPDWKWPALITTPIEQRDFGRAAEVAAAAQRWIVNASEADAKLPDLKALERTHADFEAAATLDDLNKGADKAANWNAAADKVQQAMAANAQPHDLLASLGLMGTDLQPGIDRAMSAAVAGQAEDAIREAAAVLDTINGATSVGGLRIAGLVFFAVAIAGIIGMWIVFNRQRGPSWARQTKPHWLKGKDRNPPPPPPQAPKQVASGRKLLGPGKKKK